MAIEEVNPRSRVQILRRRRAWKRIELEIAHWLGGERVPVTGRGRGWAPDVEHPWLAIEVKSWVHLPARIKEAVDQAEKAAAWAKRRRNSDRLPVAIIHATHTSFDNSLVVMRLKDAEEWFGVRCPYPPRVERPGDGEPETVS